MSEQDLCANCKHARSSHKNQVGGPDANCVWPECDCKQFVE
jgi:hypothetical protein